MERCQGYISGVSSAGYCFARTTPWPNRLYAAAWYLGEAPSLFSVLGASGWCALSVSLAPVGSTPWWWIFSSPSPPADRNGVDISCLWHRRRPGSSPSRRIFVSGSFWLLVHRASARFHFLPWSMGRNSRPNFHHMWWYVRGK